MIFLHYYITKCTYSDLSSAIKNMCETLYGESTLQDNGDDAEVRGTLIKIKVPNN